MKHLFTLRAVLALAAALGAPAAVHASTYIKADNTNSLDQAISWGGTAPTSTDIANWSGTYSATATGVAAGSTNSLCALFPGSALAWQGITVGTVAGTALTTNTITPYITNVVNATEVTTAITGSTLVTNIVTVTTKAAHGYACGQSVTIAGVTPAGYNGTYTIVGVPSSTTFQVFSPTAGLAALTGFGTVQSVIYVGGAGTATTSSQLTIGTSGIDLSQGNVSVCLNAKGFSFSGNQTWNVPPGGDLHFGATGVGAANSTVLTSGNDGTITVTGGGVVDANEGGSTGFSDAAGWAGFSGNWIVNSGTTLRGYRQGATAFGTGTITLNGGKLALGGLSGGVGSWTWTVPITLQTGTTSYLSDENETGTGRYAKLNMAIAGAGNVTFLEAPNYNFNAFTSLDLGFILTGANTFSGTMTIGGPVENGFPGRLTYVRVGGTQTSSSDTGTGAGNAGSLGTGNVVNNGVLTFMDTTAISVPNVISGTGTLRVGSLASTYVGAAYQTVTLLANNTYTGPTIINAGTLQLGASGSIVNSASITLATNSVNGGAVVNTFDVSALPAGFVTSPGQTLNLLGGQVLGSLNLAAGSTNLLVPAGSNTVGTLSISGNLTLSGGSNTLVLDINNVANDQVSVGGNLTASGVTTLQFVPPGTGINAGTYTLMTVSGTLSATPANFNIAGLAAGARPQTFRIAISGGAVQLVVVGSPGSLTWVGDGVNNAWDTDTTKNWFNTLTSAKDYFFAGDLVTFDDTGSNSPAIKLASPLKPGAVTFNNSAQNYTLSGAGQITGPTTLTMNGSGLLTLNTSNSFTGVVMVNGGTIAITNEAALGEPTNVTANSLSLNGGALLTTNALVLGLNTNRGILLGGGGSFIVTNGSTLTIASVVGDTNGSSVLTKIGDGTLILNGNNNYGGGTIVDGGAVVCGSSHGLGLSGSWCPGFTLNAGMVDINGQGNYGNASLAVSNNLLFNSVFITFAGNAGATMTLTDSVPGHAGFCLYGTSPVNTVITYSGANNPGKATIGAPWYAVGTGAYPRTYQVQVDSSTATSVGVEFTAQMSYLGYEGKWATVQKTGAGTMAISAPNYFPGLQVSAGTLLVNHPYALGADRSPNYQAQGTGMTNLVTVDGGTIDLNGFSPAIEGLTDNGAGTGTILNNGPTASTLTLGYSPSNSVVVTSYGGVLADGTSALSLVMTGSGMQTLTGNNTYSGTTTVSNGTLVIDAPGQIGLGKAASTVAVVGGAFGGSGTVNAPVFVQAGGTLAPGAGASTTVTMTITTNLTLSGACLMNVDKDTATNDLVVLTGGTVNYGGTLVVATNLMQSTTLASGDTFQLFSAPAHSGAFHSIVGSPGPGLAWRFNPANGLLSVVNFVPQPRITSITLSGNQLVISGTNGVVGAQYHVLTTTNLALPLTQWSVGSPTNTFSAETFSVTNTVNPSAPQNFYLISTP